MPHKRVAAKTYIKVVPQEMTEYRFYLIFFSTNFLLHVDSTMIFQDQIQIHALAI